MNKPNRSTSKRTPSRTPSRTKRNQQMSLGGLLLALLVALITWWSGGGDQPAAQPANLTPTPAIEAAGAQSTVAATPTARSTVKKATPPPQIKVVDSAQPHTPTQTPTSVKKATPKAAKVATATPRPTATPTRAKPPTAKPPTPTVKPPAPTAKPPTPTPKPQRATGVTGLPTIRYEQLPKEARRTIELIDNGGPFPFYQDGAVFQNREGHLPRKSRGYYHEYTVITPGENDRGARRIVTGDRGELFYTDDHYDSFKEVVR